MLRATNEPGGGESEGSPPPASVLAPGSALGSRPRVALSSVQVVRDYTANKGIPFGRKDLRKITIDAAVMGDAFFAVVKLFGD